VKFENLREDINNRNNIKVTVEKSNGDKVSFDTKHTMSDRQINILLKGGIINEFKERIDAKELGADVE
jgi:aconitate hydratase